MLVFLVGRSTACVKARSFIRSIKLFDSFTLSLQGKSFTSDHSMSGNLDVTFPFCITFLHGICEIIEVIIISQWTVTLYHLYKFRVEQARVFNCLAND